MISVERTDFLSVPVEDMARATRFYAETLGIHNASEDAAWPEFETGNVTLALVEPEKFDMEFAPLPFGAIAIRVPDVEAARKALEDAGVELKGETWDSGVCNGAAFTDPDGNGLLIHHRYAPYADGRTP